MKRLLLALPLFASLASGAATFRVDDSASLPNEANTPMQWKSLAPNRAVGNAIEGTMVVQVRLNTAPWINKTGKIYMALPEQPIGTVTADWSTQGRLLPGSLVSGRRTLVYSGPIRTSLLEDTIALRISADGRRVVSPQRLQFYFEIDVD